MFHSTPWQTSSDFGCTQSFRFHTTHYVHSTLAFHPSFPFSTIYRPSVTRLGRSPFCRATERGRTGDAYTQTENDLNLFTDHNRDQKREMHGLFAPSLRPWWCCYLSLCSSFSFTWIMHYPPARCDSFPLGHVKSNTLERCSSARTSPANPLSTVQNFLFPSSIDLFTPTGSFIVVLIVLPSSWRDTPEHNYPLPSASTSPLYENRGGRIEGFLDVLPLDTLGYRRHWQGEARVSLRCFQLPSAETQRRHREGEHLNSGICKSSQRRTHKDDCYIYAASRPSTPVMPVASPHRIERIALDPRGWETA